MTEKKSFINEMENKKVSDDTCDCGCWLYIPLTISRKDLLLEYDGEKYNLVYQPNHPYADKNGNILNHRIVMEKYLSRYLFPDEHVYHIDKTNMKYDDLDNLQLKSQYEPHMTKHIMKKSEMQQ